MLAHGGHRVDNEKLFINRVEAIAVCIVCVRWILSLSVLFFMYFYISITLVVKLKKQAVGGCSVPVSDK